MFSKKILAVALLALSFNVSATTDGIPASKKILIDKLLAQTGQSAVAVGKQYSDLFTQQMTLILKQSKPDINPKAFDIVEEEINAIMDEEFVINDSFKTMMYPIYNKHFTEDELRKMIEINDTEFGKKVNSCNAAYQSRRHVSWTRIWTEIRSEDSKTYNQAF